MSPSGQSCPCGLTDVTSHVLLVALVCLLAVCDGYINVARGKPATQIDIYMEDPMTAAGRAVDGVTDFVNAGWTHTNSVTNTWWVVDFLRGYLVHEVNITNRPGGTSVRLKQFTVQVSQENPLKHAGFPISLPGQLCFYRDSPISGSAPETIPCASPILGRYLTVFKAANNVLTICELEVMATNVTQQFLFQAVPNIRKQAKPFFTHIHARSGLECLSLCSRPQNGTATVVQYRGSDGLCECIQVSYFDDPQPSDVDSPGWIMYLSKFN